MLVMAEIKYIKHLREEEGKSIQAIADTLDINWRTARKYADCADFNIALPRKRKRRRTVMDPYVDIIDTWLLEDKNLPCKQRHTAKRIHDRLVREHGFGGARGQCVNMLLSGNGSWANRRRNSSSFLSQKLTLRRTLVSSTHSRMEL